MKNSTEKVHPIVDLALGGLSKDEKGSYLLTDGGRSAIKQALARMSGATKSSAIRELAMLAYMLEKKQASPDAAKGILEITEAAG